MTIDVKGDPHVLRQIKRDIPIQSFCKKRETKFITCYKREFKVSGRVVLKIFHSICSLRKISYLTYISYRGRKFWYN